jgi:hypothetical protein
MLSAESKDWLLVMVAVSFFAFFGFAEEAITNYKKVFRFIGKAFGFTSDPSYMLALSSYLKICASTAAYLLTFLLG